VLEMNRAWNANYFTYIKAYIGIIYLYMLRIGNRRKYAFETFRNKTIIECLKPEEVLILGGRADYYACRANNYQFVWIGGVVAAIIVATRDGHILPLKLQISLARKRFEASKRYFLLYEDQLPVGIFFAIFANEYSHISICIAHGVPSTEELILDGFLCKYHLLYQLDHKDDLRPDSIYFELGPPFDIEWGDDVSSTIILVGTGLQALMPTFYRKSLDCYRQIRNILEDLGWNVVYRPHPSERAHNFASHFSAVDTSSKVSCLSGSKKLFIGYQSTLIYEAKAFGHTVVTLGDPDVGKLKRFTPDKEIAATSVESIKDSLSELHAESKKRPHQRLRPLRDRFLPILREIEACNECE